MSNDGIDSSVGPLSEPLPFYCAECGRVLDPGGRERRRQMSGNLSGKAAWGLVALYSCRRCRAHFCFDGTDLRPDALRNANEYALLVDRRGNYQILPAHYAGPIHSRQAFGFRNGTYRPTTLEKETTEPRHYRIFIEDGVAMFPPISRQRLPPFALLALFDQFDAVAEHAVVDGNPITLGGGELVERRPA